MNAYRGGGEPTALAWAVARDIGEGLTFLHSRGFVHRDLKPHNVLLAESGRSGVGCCSSCVGGHQRLCACASPAAVASFHQDLHWRHASVCLCRSNSAKLCIGQQVPHNRSQMGTVVCRRAKVSDMGLCTRLHNDASSFETPGAGTCAATMSRML